MFFRVIELHDGRWSCRQGRSEFDVHQDRDSAVDHVTHIAAEHAPAEVYLHQLSGSACRIGAAG